MATKPFECAYQAVVIIQNCPTPNNRGSFGLVSYCFVRYAFPVSRIFACFTLCSLVVSRSGRE